MSLFLLVSDTTGDPLADKRFAYAQDFWRNGDLGAAVDMARQTLELAPRFVPALRMLGDGLLELGEPDQAVAAYRTALEVDPSDRLGVRTRMARIGAVRAEEAMTDAYIQTLFDNYAPIYEEHLVQMLGYRGPDALVETLAAHAGSEAALQFPNAVDIGCGTGLVGVRIQGLCGHLAGSDIAAGMVELARAKNVYDELLVLDAAQHLGGLAPGSIDLVTAGDCLNYIADLAPVFAAAGQALRPGGLFVMTVQVSETEDVVFGSDMRYAQSLAYLDRCGQAGGLARLAFNPTMLRNEGGSPIPAAIALYERA